MGFGTQPLSKFDYAATAAAALAYLILQQHDAVGLRLFDDKLQGAVPVSSNWHGLQNILAMVEPRSRRGRATSRCRCATSPTPPGAAR